MAYTYQYSLNTYFSGGVNLSCLQYDISENASITTPIVYCGIEDEVVSIIFENELSSPELVELNTTISGHDPLVVCQPEVIDVDTIYATYIESTTISGGDINSNEENMATTAYVDEQISTISGGGTGNIDGGFANSTYGGSTDIDGGSANSY